MYWSLILLLCYLCWKWTIQDVGKELRKKIFKITEENKSLINTLVPVVHKTAAIYPNLLELPFYARQLRDEDSPFTQEIKCTRKIKDKVE